MKKVLLTLCGAVLLMALLTAPAMASLWRSDLVCDLNGDGMFSDLGQQRPYAVIQGFGELYVSSIHGLPPNMPFTCAINCFFEGGFLVADCGKTDANGRLPAQRIRGFLLPGVCAGIDFFLVDTPTLGDDAACVDGVVIPQ
jgi:hypothetical protein